MRPVKTEATTEVDGDFPHHHTMDGDLKVTISEWEFEPEEWDIWAESRDRLILLATYPDGTAKMMVSQVRKAE